MDEQTLLQSVPRAWQAEYAQCQELVTQVILGELDPANSNGEAYRDGQRERFAPELV